MVGAELAKKKGKKSKMQHQLDSSLSSPSLLTVFSHITISTATLPVSEQTLSQSGHRRPSRSANPYHRLAHFTKDRRSLITHHESIIMAARRAQAPLAQLARSIRAAVQADGSSSSRVTLAPSTSSLNRYSQARGLASAATSAASTSRSAAASPSPASTRGAGYRSSPALGTQITGEQVLSHFSSTPFTSSSPDLLGSNAELALRAVTHESYLNAREGHNRRLAFVGRRTLKLFTTLYLHSRLQTASKGDAAHNYINRLLESPSAVDSILNTHRLGDKVGRDLGLEKVMRWTPAVTDGQMGPRETGLFKVRGVAVEALVGAIYHQKGALEASKFFQSSILPSLLQDGFPGPVPEQLTQRIASPAAQS